MMPIQAARDTKEPYHGLGRVLELARCDLGLVVVHIVVYPASFGSSLPTCL
jgi:hypothetical protein